MSDETTAFGSGTFGSQQGASLSAHMKQLITDCLVSASVDESDPEYRIRCLTFANYVYLRLLQGRQWNFTNREQSFDLSAPYKVGTVGLIEGSYTVEEDVDVANGFLPLATWNANMVGAMFCPAPNDQDFYRILEVKDSKTLKTNAAYSGTTAQYQTYKTLFDRYQLTPNIQEVKNVTIRGGGKIQPCDLQQFRTMKMSNPCLEGQPTYYTINHIEEDSGQKTIEFYPAPDKRYSALIEFSERPVRLEDTETCFPLIPPEHMNALYYGVLAEIYRFQNNSAQAREVGALAAESFRKLASDFQVTDPVASIKHRRGYFNRRGRGSSGYFGLKWFGKVDN